MDIEKVKQLINEIEIKNNNYQWSVDMMNNQLEKLEDLMNNLKTIVINERKEESNE